MSPVSLFPIPLTAVQQYLRDRGRDMSGTKKRLDYGLDSWYGYVKTPSIIDELHYHCVALREECSFEDDFAHNGTGLSLVLDQAREHTETQDFVNSDAFRIWNTPLSRPWHNDHSPCLCFGEDKTEMCGVCYQINTKLKRPWYIENPGDSYRSANQRVCEICSHIDWPLILGPKREVCESYLYIPLGTLSELQQRKHCAVCSLIMATLALSRDYPSAIVTAGGENITVGVLVEDTARLEVEFKVLPYQLNDDRLIYRIKLYQITAESIPGLGRRVHQERVDVNLLRHWIATCDSLHGTLPEKKSFSLMRNYAPPLRLIDVVEECIVERNIECCFLALSYVWVAVRSSKVRRETNIYLNSKAI